MVEFDISDSTPVLDSDADADRRSIDEIVDTPRQREMVTLLLRTHDRDAVRNAVEQFNGFVLDEIADNYLRVKLREVAVEHVRDLDDVASAQVEGTFELANQGN
ncbi:hypothetical protein [Halobacterium bonnevillei]|uniref:Putative peptidase inhibitor domain-containing protein n=1 Tax=Halobacterium bonnevillei TaxID=2692200 RepID=A0A6B0SR94_9EURY|nr:hypothetical protein [Halobacterium bonnevillei]MXR22103.1 hypothetical protein [Halobacterium bonnevillei]